MSDSPRKVALDALVRVEEGAYSNLDLPVRLRRSKLDARDRAWVTDAVYTTLRQQRRLDALVALHSTRPLDELDPPVRAALRLGAYQLVDGVAPHAAVGETVSATPPSARRYVNAVLRALSRSGPPFPEPDDAGTRLSYPDWIVTELVEQFGRDDAEAALAAMNDPPSVTLRVQTGRVSADALSAELHQAGGRIEPGRLVADALRVTGLGDLAKVRAVRDGRATPQDEASQAVAALVDAHAGERVLDVASAPGGKTTAIATRVGADGMVVAADLHDGRLGRVREAAGRLQLRTVHAVVADGTRPPWRPAAFDRVLLDAPCSGLGVLRRRAEARWRTAPDRVAGLAGLQVRLMAASAQAVRVGGRLVYSVCTLTGAETLGVDSWAGAHLPDFVALAPPAAPWRAHGRGAVLLPHDAGTDGMFVLVLERVR